MEREPDIDFNDVFGGPPRRSSSIHETRYSFTESMRYSNSSLRGEEEEEIENENKNEKNDVLHRNPWSGMMERPVFGDSTANRRKYPSDDFYDDIYRGDESVGSPRRSSHDPFISGSGPSSRVLSPARPLPPRASDPFGSSLPAQVQFSLPAKLTRAMDSPALASGVRSSHKHKEPISNVKGFQNTPSSPLYRPSPLSHEVSVIAKSDELKSLGIQSNTKKDLKATEARNNANQFHFSIYKWASKGVPLTMPLRGVYSTKSKDKAKTERFSSFNERIEDEKIPKGTQKADIQDADNYFPKRSVPGNSKVHHLEEIKQDMASPPQRSTVDTNLNSGSTEKGASQSAQEAQNTELKSLRSFLGTTEEGNSDMKRKSDLKDETVKKNAASDTIGEASKKVQKRDGKKYNSKGAEATHVKEPQLKDMKKTFEETLGKSKVKGKVKDFVQKFNQEADVKPKVDIENRSYSSQQAKASIYRAEKESSTKTPQTIHTEVQGLNKIGTSANDAATLDKNHKKSEKQQSYLNSKAPVLDVKGSVRGQKDSEASIPEPLRHETPIVVEDLDDLFQENFTVQELTSEQEKQFKSEDNNEDVKTSDARIRKWSKGKEGNIRSLLSTLQYVLWPGSGWKPVALVDIIEGSAVKRSYQKALLCLHPDKLQQKGAADYQKYIAEKVFDILQEAWDQFNSLGLL